MHTIGRCYLRSPNCAKACAITLLCSNDSSVRSAQALWCQLLTSSTLLSGSVRPACLELHRTESMRRLSHWWAVHLEPPICPCHTLAILVEFCCLDKTPWRKQRTGEKAYLAHSSRWQRSIMRESEAGESINQLSGPNTLHNQESTAKWMLLSLFPCAQLCFPILRHFRTPCLGNAAAGNEMLLPALVNLIREFPGQADLV